MKWQFTQREAQYLTAEEYEQYAENGCIEGCTRLSYAQVQQFREMISQLNRQVDWETEARIGLEEQLDEAREQNSVLERKLKEKTLSWKVVYPW